MNGSALHDSAVVLRRPAPPPEPEPSEASSESVPETLAAEESSRAGLVALLLLTASLAGYFWSVRG